jgi:hypothetical protein
MRLTTRAVVLLAATVAMTGCTRSGGSRGAGTLAPRSGQVSVQLAWSHTGTFFGDPRVVYVVRVDNRHSAPASVALDTRALDSTGTIVGSSSETLPNIPANSHFDFFGHLGGGIGPELTGTPAKIEVSPAENAFGRAGSVDLPMLRTSEVMLKTGTEDTYTDMAHSYDLTAKVTNTIDEPLTVGVTQQTVLYDQAGNIVGGDTGSSNNVPHGLRPGQSYHESWTGIPALRPAVRAEYTVWPFSF